MWLFQWTRSTASRHSMGMASAFPTAGRFHQSERQKCGNANYLLILSGHTADTCPRKITLGLSTRGCGEWLDCVGLVMARTAHHALLSGRLVLAAGGPGAAPL